MSLPGGSTVLQYVFQTRQEYIDAVGPYIEDPKVLDCLGMSLDKTNLNEEQIAKYRVLALNHAKEKERLADLENTNIEMPKKEAKSRKCRVFTRVRPLSEIEKKEDEGKMMENLVAATSLGTDQNRVSATKGDPELPGFHGVFGTDADNEMVYKATLQACLDVTLAGGSTSAFCYGHSGTGKTHTSLGYQSEPGLFKLACADLLKRLDELNKSQQDGGKLMLSVRFTEVYLDQIFDLLNGRKQSKLAEDRQGNIRLRQEVASKNLDGQEVFFSADQSFVIIKDIDHLMTVLKDGIALRACGSSSIHDQSSRSHALLEMEIVNEAVLKAREEWLEASALETAPHHGTQQGLQETMGKGDDALVFFVPSAERKVEKDDEGNWTYMPPHTYLLCDPHIYEGGGETISVEEWCKRADRFFASFDVVSKKAEKATLVRIEKEKALAHALKTAPEIVGGRLILVDLAGADHDNRDLKQSTKTELKESADINKQLFTLKNCISKLGTDEKRIAWRDTKLTMLLKSVLMPPEGGNCQPIMIATVSPAIGQQRDTMNTLRYGQMVTGVSLRKRKKPTRARNPRSEAAIAEIKKIYAEKCPEKTEEDVKRILSKFAGREPMLLAKMKKKYQSAPAESAVSKEEPPVSKEEYKEYPVQEKPVSEPKPVESQPKPVKAKPDPALEGTESRPSLCDESARVSQIVEPPAPKAEDAHEPTPLAPSPGMFSCLPCCS